MLTVLLVFVAMAAVLCALEGQRVLRLNSRKKKRQVAAPNELALLCWVNLERYAAVLRLSLPEELLEIAQLAKYSRHTVTEAQLKKLFQAERELIVLLKHRNILKRLADRWWSVLY